MEQVFATCQSQNLSATIDHDVWCARLIHITIYCSRQILRLACSKYLLHVLKITTLKNI